MATLPADTEVPLLKQILAAIEAGGGGGAPYDAGALTGNITLNFANGSSQFGYMSGNTVFQVPTGTPVECQSEITFVIQWNTGQTLDFASGIKRASESSATFPKTLTTNKSYVFKLKYMGWFWCLTTLVGGFDSDY